MRRRKQWCCHRRNKGKDIARLSLRHAAQRSGNELPSLRVLGASTFERIKTKRQRREPRGAEDAETFGHLMKDKRSPRLDSAAASWRMFCAIELSDSLRQQLARHIEQLRAAVPEAHASWSRPENIHLTLKFFGDVKQHLVSKISAAAERAVDKVGPFQIAVAGAGAFPKPSQPRVLWIGLEDPSRTLATLQGQVENECAKERFAKEERPFHPHLTIARIRHPEGSRTLADFHQQLGFTAQPFLVNEIVVFRSELGSQGSKYTALSRHKFRLQITPITEIPD